MLRGVLHSQVGHALVQQLLALVFTIQKQLKNEFHSQTPYSLRVNIGMLTGVLVEQHPAHQAHHFTIVITELLDNSAVVHRIVQTT
jgi:hypothetical protein